MTNVIESCRHNSVLVTRPSGILEGECQGCGATWEAGSIGQRIARFFVLAVEAYGPGKMRLEFLPGPEGDTHDHDITAKERTKPEDGRHRAETAERVFRECLAKWPGSVLVNAWYFPDSDAGEPRKQPTSGTWPLHTRPHMDRLFGDQSLYRGMLERDRLELRLKAETLKRHQGVNRALNAARTRYEDSAQDAQAAQAFVREFDEAWLGHYR